MGWLLEDFCDWLLKRGFTGDTIRKHLGFVLHLNEWLGEGATAEALSDLSATRIESFFLDYAHETGHSSRRSMQAALRTFLRFCFYEGYIRHCLDHAVPTLRTYKLARVPRGLGEPQAQAVLQSLDRNTEVGRRDYAILTILHTYGIRGGQVRTLEFIDRVEQYKSIGAGTDF